jgi:hypothetical protein
VKGESHFEECEKENEHKEKKLTNQPTKKQSATSATARHNVVCLSAWNSAIYKSKSCLCNVCFVTRQQ